MITIDFKNWLFDPIKTACLKNKKAQITWREDVNRMDPDRFPKKPRQWTVIGRWSFVRPRKLWVP